jgi:hypothetical protein
MNNAIRVFVRVNAKTQADALLAAGSAMKSNLIGTFFSGGFIVAPVAAKKVIEVECQCKADEMKQYEYLQDKIREAQGLEEFLHHKPAMIAAKQLCQLDDHYSERRIPCLGGFLYDYRKEMYGKYYLIELLMQCCDHRAVSNTVKLQTQAAHS